MCTSTLPCYTAWPPTFSVTPAQLKKKGLGPNARRWVSLLMAGTRAAVTFGGARSRFFTMHSGVAQGSPLSPLLYVIAVQLLAAALRRLQVQGIIDAVKLPGGATAPASHQHADDITIHTATVESARNAIERAVQPFCAASGSVLNINKCKGVTLGAHPPLIGHHQTTGTTFIDATTTLPHLGVLLTKGDARTATDEAWQKVVNAVRVRVSHWRSVPLTILGRAYVAKQLMASVITHLATFVDPSPQRLRDVQALIDGYIVNPTISTADGGPSGDRALRGRPPAAVAALPKANVPLQAAALRARVALRLLHPQQRPWKALARANFDRAFPGLGAAVMLTTIKPTAVRGLSPRLASYWGALRAARPFFSTEPVLH
jgi:hypothetical protein